MHYGIQQADKKVELDPAPNPVLPFEPENRQTSQDETPSSAHH